MWCLHSWLNLRYLSHTAWASKQLQHTDGLSAHLYVLSYSMNSSANITLRIPTMLFGLYRYTDAPQLITSVVLRAATIEPRVKSVCMQLDFPDGIAESVIFVDQQVLCAVESGTLPQLLAKGVMYYDMHKLSVLLGANIPCVEINMHCILANQLVSDYGGQVPTAFLHTALEWQSKYIQSRKGWVPLTSFEYLIQFDE